MNIQFKGQFSLNKVLDLATFNFLCYLAFTRRLKRKGIDPKYGIDGEFFVTKSNVISDATIVNSNTPPSTQPSLHCNWIPSSDGSSIKWNGMDDFTYYVEWIEYIISKVLAPRGYILNGVVTRHMHPLGNIGQHIEVRDNMVNGKRLIVDYSINRLLGNYIYGKETVVAPKPKSKKDKKKQTQLELQAKIKELEDQLRASKTTVVVPAAKPVDPIALLEQQVQHLTIELNQRAAELKLKKNAISVNDTMLENLKKAARVGGTLADFKAMLKNLMEEK